MFGKKEKNITESEKNQSIIERRNIRAIKSLIAPSGIDATHTNHLEIISNRVKYARTLFASNLPRSAVFPELLREMYLFPDSNISVFIEPVPTGKSQTDLNKEITEITSEIYVARKRGDRNRERLLEIKVAELEEMRDQIELGYTSIYNSSIITTLFAYSMDELNNATEKLASATGKTLLTVKSAWANQDQGFISNMPYNDNKLTSYHNFDKGSMGTVFPFFNAVAGHNSGIPLGINLETGLPILYDNFSPTLSNYNMVLFGKSGAGKGVTIKVITARSYVLQGIETLALDPEGEYRDVAEALGGVNITISPTSKTIINIFDIEPEIEIDDITRKEIKVLRVENKVEDATQALLTMAKGSTKTEVDEVMKQIISEVVAAEYKALGINENVESLYINGYDTLNITESEGRIKKEMPTIGSWYKRLEKVAKKPENKPYEKQFIYLLKVMKQYVKEFKGQLSYFDGQSTFNLTDHIPFINFDISLLEEKFARPLAQQILLSWVWEKYVKKNSEDKTKANKKRVIIDEAWMLLEYKEAVDFLNTMARRARKRNVSLAVVSQRFADFYGNQSVEAILTSSDTKIFLAHSAEEVQQIRETFKLSAGEAEFLSTCEVGRGLLKIHEDTATLGINVSQKERDFVDTNLNTQVARRMNETQREI